MQFALKTHSLKIRNLIQTKSISQASAIVKPYCIQNCQALKPNLHGQTSIANTVWPNLYGQHSGQTCIAKPLLPTLYGQASMAKTLWPSFYDQISMAKTLRPKLYGVLTILNTKGFVSVEITLGIGCFLINSLLHANLTFPGNAILTETLGHFPTCLYCRCCSTFIRLNIVPVVCHNSFLASGDFCHLRITFANSLNSWNSTFGILKFLFSIDMIKLTIL